MPRSGRNYVRRTTTTCAGRSESKAARTNETHRKRKEREDGGSGKQRRGKTIRGRKRKDTRGGVGIPIVVDFSSTLVLERWEKSNRGATNPSVALTRSQPTIRANGKVPTTSSSTIASGACERVHLSRTITPSNCLGISFRDVHRAFACHRARVQCHPRDLRSRSMEALLPLLLVAVGLDNQFLGGYPHAMHTRHVDGTPNFHCAL